MFRIILRLVILQYCALGYANFENDEKIHLLKQKKVRNKEVFFFIKSDFLTDKNTKIINC